MHYYNDLVITFHTHPEKFVFFLHQVHFLFVLYFEVFSIWNDENICLSWNDTEDWCKLLGLTTVPVLYRGIFDEKFLRNYKINTDKQEGYVIRLADSFNFDDFDTSIAKWVRKGHVQTSAHWLQEKVIPNLLK